MFKSKSTRKTFKKKPDSDESVPPTRPAPPNLLPQLLPDSFRQSLILPHLTARFKLLRTGDGSLVNLEVMQAHLAIQRKTGILSGFEVDAVLQQYAREAALAPSPTFPSSKSQSDLLRSPSFANSSWSQGESSLLNPNTASIISTTSSSPYAPSSIGGHSSAVPFPYDSPSPPPESPNMSPSNSNPISPVNISNFRRGGNSMFGGNVKSFAQLKMVKSGSQNSLKGIARGKSEDSKRESFDSKFRNSQEDSYKSSVSTEREEEEVLEPQQRLTQSSFNRISRVLDDFQAELINAGNPSVRSRSPNMSDTESIDPHYARLAASPVVSKFRRPSATSLQSSYTLTSRSRSPTSENYLEEEGSGLGRSGNYGNYAGERMDTATPNSYTTIQGVDGRIRSRTSPEVEREGSHFDRSLRSSLNSSIGSPISPFETETSFLPIRVGGELGELSDENPFDLSYTSHSTLGGERSWREGDLVEQEEDGSRDYLEKERKIERDSDGSSYRPMEEESDQEITSVIDSATAPSHNKHLLPNAAVEAIPRKSSEDLINDLRGVNGENDLALEDLVAIQERLVRSASRRAARRLGTDLEELEEEEAGLKSADSFDWRKSGLITSLSDAERLQQLATEAELEEDETLDITNSLVVPPSLLGAPVILDPPPRLARNSPRRDPTIRQSLLVRDVRNQANAATMALRKSPISNNLAGGKLIKSKSIKNLSISEPIFVSGPSDIPAVPIINSQMGHGYTEGHSRKKSSQGSNGGGMGFKFRLLVKKNSKENMGGNEEITPFVGEFEEAKNLTPPFTPPSAFGSSRGMELINTPSDYGRNDYPRTPESKSPFPFSVPSPMPTLPPTEEMVNGKSPASSLNRLVSRLRRPKKESIDITRISEPSSIIGAEMSESTFDSSLASSETRILHLPIPSSPPTRRRNEEIEIGISNSPASSIISERQATTYDISSMRRARNLLQGTGTEASDTIAPLTVKKVITDEPEEFDEGRMRKRISTTSMKKLWRVAKDLGLEEDGAEEFVKASYGGRESRIIGLNRTESLEGSPRVKNLSGLVIDNPSPMMGRLNVVEDEEMPLSPGKSMRSLRSDDYDAGSVFDLYGDESEENSPIEQRELEREGQETFRGEEFYPGEEEEDYEPPSRSRNITERDEDSTLYAALSTLRNRPLSETFETNHFRHSLESQFSQEASATPKVEKFSELVSRHRRNQSSLSNFQTSSANSIITTTSATTTSSPPAAFAREGKAGMRLPSPSIYFREEKRLVNLEGGVAVGEEGLFLVRTALI